MILNLAHGAAIAKGLIGIEIRLVNRLIVITLAHFAVMIWILKNVVTLLLVAIMVVRRKGIVNLGNGKPLFERRKNEKTI